MTAPRVFLWFIDGLALGEDNHIINPLAAEPVLALRKLLAGPPFFFTGVRVKDHAAAVALDPSLNTAGLPQSATGQTALFTGVNAAQVVGRHLNGFPTPTLTGLLRKDNLFIRLVKAGLTVNFINAFSGSYLAALAGYKLRQGLDNSAAQEAVFQRAISCAFTGNNMWLRRFRPSASTVAVDAAGLALRDWGDLRSGSALFHDITGKSFWQPAANDLVEHLPEPITVAEAVKIAVSSWEKYDLTFFETFITDIIGHRQDMEHAREFTRRIDAFLAGLLAKIDVQRELLVIISDHGNFEDLSVKTHTNNPVPLAAFGHGARLLVEDARQLTDFLPNLLKLWNLP